MSDRSPLPLRMQVSRHLLAALCWSLLAPAQTLPAPKNDNSPLIAAIHKRDLPEVEKLIKSRANLDLRDSEGSTALLESIALHMPGVAKQLILAGANPNLGDDKEGVSPLMQAAWYCQTELVPLLLEHGAAVDAKDGNGYTALMWAVSNCGDGKIVGLLLASGASVNVRNKHGGTALTVAAFAGDEVAVRKLVAAGADLNARDDGETALTIARDREVGRKKSHDRIYAFLRSAAKRSRN